MVQTMPGFIKPPGSAKLWRYIDFTKFVSLLDSQCLFFARADSFDDKFEGSMAQANADAWRRFANLNADIPQSKGGDLAEKIINMRKEIRTQVGLNCWHMNEHESAAMWNLYLKSNEGVAIQTTCTRFEESINDPRTIFLGLVKYIDFQTEGMHEYNDALTPFTYKRKSYEHEREVRGLIWERSQSFQGGLRVRVDVSKLVETVFVAPTCPRWLFDLVKEVGVKYGHSFPVKQSDLDNDPVY